VLIILYLLSDQLVYYASTFEGRGTLSYSYMIGEEAVTSIVATLPEDLSEAMVIEDANGWTASLDGNILSLSSGSLTSGESVHIAYRLSRYIPSGVRIYDIEATTETGSTFTTEGSVAIPEMFPMRTLGLISNYGFWVLVLAAIVLLAITLQVAIGRKEKVTKVEVTVSTEPKDKEQ